MALETVVYGGGGGGGGGWSFGLQLEDKALLDLLDNNMDHQQTGLYENWDQYSSSSLETVVYGGGGGGGGGWSFGLQLEDKALLDLLDNNMDHQQSVKEYDHNSSPEARTVLPTMETPSASTKPTQGRRKRRRAETCKNKEEVENQRMTHISVERNRRKQMNEYLSVLRSLMPSSYVQRGDQASIIGGAVNFVKELEQHLMTLEGQTKIKQEPDENGFSNPPFSEFFSFPQYTTTASQCKKNSPGMANEPITANDDGWLAAVADIEVTKVESHANLKIRSKRRPKQLLKMVAGFQSLRLTVLHLNVTTVDQLVLYSVSVEVEDGCGLTSVDDIAAAVNQMLHKIEEESFLG